MRHAEVLRCNLGDHLRTCRDRTRHKNPARMAGTAWRHWSCDVRLMDRAGRERWPCGMGRDVVAAMREVAMLRKRKAAKAKKRILETLLRDMHGTPAK